MKVSYFEADHCGPLGEQKKSWVLWQKNHGLPQDRTVWEF